MPAPKNPNTAAATAAVRRRGQETMAAKLRAAGWTCTPPEQPHHYDATSVLDAARLAVKRPSQDSLEQLDMRLRHFDEKQHNADADSIVDDETQVLIDRAEYRGYRRGWEDRGERDVAREHDHDDRRQCPVYGCPWSVCAHLVYGDHDCADPTSESTCYYGQDR